MTAPLRAMLFVISLIFLVSVFRLVYKGRLLLKYSLLWMVLSIVLLLCAIFPQAIGEIGNFFGIATPANFVFLIGFVCLLGICIALTVIVGWQARDVRYLVQEVALLRKEQEGRQDDVPIDKNGHIVRS